MKQMRKQEDQRAVLIVTARDSLIHVPISLQEVSLLFHLGNRQSLPAVSNNLNSMLHNSNNDNFLKCQLTSGEIFFHCKNTFICITISLDLTSALCAGKEVFLIHFADTGRRGS